MAKINLTEDILRHKDEEIIDYLADECRAVRSVVKKSLDSGEPQRLYAMLADIEIITTVVLALDRRNKEDTI